MTYTTIPLQGEHELIGFSLPHTHATNPTRTSIYETYQTYVQSK